MSAAEKIAEAHRKRLTLPTNPSYIRRALKAEGYAAVRVRADQSIDVREHEGGPWRAFGSIETALCAISKSITAKREACR